MLISGVIPFSNKKQKLAAWKQLKQEFGSRVEIVIESNMIAYSCRVSRKEIF